MKKALQIIEKTVRDSRGGGGILFYGPYEEIDKAYFKVLWPRRQYWREEALGAMVKLFGIEFIVVNENGEELRRMT